MSDSKVRRKFYLNHEPEFINVADATTDGASTIVPVDEQIDTINAISAYNQKLPAKRKAKGESLPEIPTNNIMGKMRIVKEYKKTGVKTVEATTFNKVGIVDGGETTPMNDDIFSMTAK